MYTQTTHASSADLLLSDHVEEMTKIDVVLDGLLDEVVHGVIVGPRFHEVEERVCAFGSGGGGGGGSDHLMTGGRRRRRWDVGVRLEGVGLVLPEVADARGLLLLLLLLGSRGGDGGGNHGRLLGLVVRVGGHAGSDGGRSRRSTSRGGHLLGRRDSGGSDGGRRYLLILLVLPALSGIVAVAVAVALLGDGDDHLTGHLQMRGHVLAADGVGPLEGAVALLLRVGVVHVVHVGRRGREGGGVASIADATGEGDGHGHRHGHRSRSGCNRHNRSRGLDLDLILHLLALVDTAQTDGLHAVEVRFGLGIAGPLETGALDAGAGDVLGEEGHAAEKVLVVVTAVVAASGQPLEAVQVELPLEAGDLGLLEVVRHDRGDELLGLVDGKGPAVGEPRDDVGVAVPLDLVEDVMELAGEGDLGAARSGRRQQTRGLAAALAALAAGHVVKADGLLDLLRRRFGRDVRLGRDLVGVVVVVVLDEVPDVALGGQAGLLRLAGALRRRLGRGDVHALDVLSLEGLEFFSPRRSGHDGGGRGSSGSFSEIDTCRLRTGIADNSRLLDGRNVDVQNVKGGVGVVGIGEGNSRKGRAVPGIDELLPLLLRTTTSSRCVRPG